MKISIITVCKNSEQYIEKAIQSIIAQTYKPIEYIVIDGQSSDRTLSILNRYRDHIATLISEPDKGVYQAMNKGIRAATGDFLFFLNSDDYLADRTVIADVMAFIAEQPACDFIYGDLEIRPQTGRPIVLKPKPPEQLLQSLTFLDGPQHPASFFRRQLFERFGLFSESYKIASDYEWFLRIAPASDLAIHYLPRTINSFSSGGLSNTSQTTSLKEIFAIQQQVPLYQTADWLEKRLQRCQEEVIHLYNQLQIQAARPPAPPASPPAAPTGAAPNVLQRTEHLRRQLNRLVHTQVHQAGLKPIDPPLSQVDVIITPNEVNQRHGTGIIVQRIFGDCPNILSIRSVNSYGGDHKFGKVSLCLSYGGLSRAEIFTNLMQVLNGTTVRRIVCVPFLTDDVWTAIALKSMFDVPLCTYLMDDHTIYSPYIPENLMQELLERSDLRLAISPEMRDVYEAKFNHKLWLAPPTLPQEFIQTHLDIPQNQFHHRKTGILIGNVWSDRWLTQLQETMRHTEFSIDWYTNPGRSPQQLEALAEDHIQVQAELPGESLRSMISQYPYAVMPTGSLKPEDDLPQIARLSLPSRLIFIVATANIPVIVVGSRDTGAAHFVEQFGIGVVCDYNPFSFAEAVDKVCDPAFQKTVRQKCAEIAPHFAADDLAEWIWRSTEQQQPIDRRFEKLLPRLPNSLYRFIEPPVPAGLWGDFVDLYQVSRRLKAQGFAPDFVIDVGASVGTWSYTVHQLFPDIPYILIDPLSSRYDAATRQYYVGDRQNFKLLEVAVSNESKKTTLQVSPDLAGSSLLNPKDFREYDMVEIEVTTLDRIAQQQHLTGRGFLKIDVQCAEHLVLAGASELLQRVDVLAVELSLPRYDTDAKTYLEMLNLIDQLGFRYYDDIGSWRSPVDGTLLQKDILFVRQELFPPLISS